MWISRFCDQCLNLLILLSPVRLVLVCLCVCTVTPPQKTAALSSLGLVSCCGPGAACELSQVLLGRAAGASFTLCASVPHYPCPSCLTPALQLPQEETLKN